MQMNSPIYIVGTPRSGTTLTANILGRHSRVFMPGENHFFEDIYARRSEIGDLASTESRAALAMRFRNIYGRYNQQEDQAAIDRLFRQDGVEQQFLAACGEYRAALNEFMALQLKETGKLRWGNNTPKDVFHIREILSFYPDAKIVVLVRDIRDFILSYKNRWQVTTRQHKERLKELYHPVVTSLLWKSSVRQIHALRKCVPAENLAVIHYEDLVTSPSATVQYLCNVIEEEYEPGMLSVETHNSSEQVSESGVFSSSVGRWQEKLPSEEAFIAQKLAGDDLLQLDYQLTPLSVKPAKVMSIVLSTPVALYRALAANRGKRGPLIPYLFRRSKSLLFRR